MRCLLPPSQQPPHPQLSPSTHHPPASANTPDNHKTAPKPKSPSGRSPVSTTTTTTSTTTTPSTTLDTPAKQHPRDKRSHPPPVNRSVHHQSRSPTPPNPSSINHHHRSPPPPNRLRDFPLRTSTPTALNFDPSRILIRQFVERCQLSRCSLPHPSSPIRLRHAQPPSKQKAAVDQRIPSVDRHHPRLPVYTSRLLESRRNAHLKHHRAHPSSPKPVRLTRVLSALNEES